MTDDLTSLSALAGAATPGPWKTADAGLGPLARSHVVDLGDVRVPRTPYVVVYGDPPYFGHSADARYIAAMSPDVALVLIARVRKAEAALSERCSDAGAQVVTPRIYGRQEPPEIVEARRRIHEYEAEQATARHAEEKKRRDDWVAQHVGRCFDVDEERYGEDRLTVSFTARLLEVRFTCASQAGPDGEMVWDNGVVTSGAVLGPALEG